MTQESLTIEALDNLQTLEKSLNEKVKALRTVLTMFGREVGEEGREAPATEKPIDWFDVPSESHPGVKYHVNVYGPLGRWQANRASCTCASYVRGNHRCKHLANEGLDRYHGETTPTNAERVSTNYSQYYR